MYIFCDGFKVSPVQQFEGTTWQDVTCYKDGKALIQVSVCGIVGSVIPTSVGETGDSTHASITDHVHRAGRFVIVRQPTDSGEREVYSVVPEGEDDWNAPVSIFVPVKGAMPDVVRADAATVVA